ncbi:MAG: fimbria/pilus outer membrane usher protein [Sphingomicrobium sp.]
MKRRHALFLSSVSLLAAVPSSTVTAAPAAADEIHAGLRESLLAVSVNGGPMGEPVVVLRAAEALYVPEQLLAQWRLRVPTALTIPRGPQRFVRLNAIAGVTWFVDEAAQTLAITAELRLLEPTRLAYAPVALGEEVVSGAGAFLNYDVSAEVADGAASIGGAIEVGLFTAYGVGISSFVANWSDNHADVVRLDSNWTIDDPVRMRSLRFGDSISRGGVGGLALRFGGIQLARNFAVQPDFVTIPLPSLRGSAAVPSVVDIYVNEALRGSREVPAGPFDLTGLPIVSGNGDVQLVVRDLLGRQTLYNQPYYSAPRMLAPGLHDYSLEAGFLRRSFALRSNDYGALMLSATERYGFSERLTGELHAEATRDIQAAGVGAALAIAGLGLAQVKLAGSHSDRGLGGQLGIDLERRARGLSLGVTAEFSSKDYRPIGLAPNQRPPASIIRAFAGMPTPVGSLGLSYLRRDGRSEPDVEYAGANASVRVARLGNLHLAARKRLNGGKELAADLFLVMPIGPRGTATAGVAIDQGGTSFNAALQRNLPVGNGFGYRFTASRGAIDRLDGKLSLQTAFAAYDAQLTWVDGRTGVRLSTAGGVGIVSGDLFASRRLDQSFASVTVGDYPDVRVYADHQLVGRTDRSGTIIVPRLRPFDRNTLSIELADLPLDAEVGDDQRIVRPYNRHGVSVNFAVHPARAAIVPLHLDDGSALPAGATVTLAGQTGEWFSVPGGDVYLTGLAADNAGAAVWPAGRCTFRFAYTANGEAQPRLTSVLCRQSVQ